MYSNQNNLESKTLEWLNCFSISQWFAIKCNSFQLKLKLDLNKDNGTVQTLSETHYIKYKKVLTNNLTEKKQYCH